MNYYTAFLGPYPGGSGEILHSGEDKRETALIALMKKPENWDEIEVCTSAKKYTHFRDLCHGIFCGDVRQIDKADDLVDLSKMSFSTETIQ